MEWIALSIGSLLIFGGGWLAYDRQRVEAEQKRKLFGAVDKVIEAVDNASKNSDKSRHDLAVMADALPKLLQPGNLEVSGTKEGFTARITEPLVGPFIILLGISLTIAALYFHNLPKAGLLE